MPVSNPVIRRYTPPTCTLEVMAQSSSLSGWTGKSVLKQLNFELRFDDPRLPEERRISIKGDRNQLEALYNAVTNYVQEFLQKSPESFWANFSEPKDSTKVSEDPELKAFNQTLIPKETLKSFNNFQMPGAEIHLESNSYLTHNLFLGSLANQISGGVIQLTLLQLFDLATALDEYSAEVMALPALNARSSTFSLPSWAPAAAVVLVALGLTPFTWQYANNIRQKQLAAKKTASTQEVALQPSPSELFPTPQPGLTPPDKLVPPLGTTPAVPGSTLPTPPAPGSILPTTPIPGSTLPTTSQLPTSAKTAPGSFPPIPQTAPGSTFSTAPLPSRGSALNIPGTTTPTLSRSSGKTPSTKLSDPFAIPTNSQQTSRTSSIPKNGIALPSTTNLPSNLPPATGDISSRISPVSPPLAAGTNARGSSNTDISASSPTAPSLGKTDNSLADKLRQGRDTPSAVATGTLFDTPQVAEARDFLKKRWQPPTGLKQTLEYSLLIGVDGKVERILPLGKAARDYIDTTGMPGIGQPFVSPNTNGQNVRIRAVFSPDGKVQTFPESQ
ncbi:MAG: DUF4335 domain-containing protein [Tolypothrix brevis GSE-NOS-MK-07-07A]|nr:DUF4335 domain-containing protein [Tolypothrix brevis GSE-NOS-MK-07-07A]